MKKIIATTLFLSAGTLLSSAASVIPESLNDDGLLYYWDFSTSSDPVKSVAGTTWNNLFAYNAAGYGSFSTDEERTSCANLSVANIAANSFTISFDFADLAVGNYNYRTLLSVYTDNGSVASHALTIRTTNQDALGILIGKENTAVMKDASFGGASKSVSGQIAEDVIGVPAWRTITITSDGTNVRAYADGELTLTLDLDTSGEKLLTGIRFGDRLGTAPVSSNPEFCAIDDIAIWNRALSAEEVASLIPEPSASGLLAGTLALAFCAARRRSRKA